MRVQPRDQLILTLCYEHGFLAVQHLDGFFSTSGERRRRMAEYGHSSLTFWGDPPVPEARPVLRLKPAGVHLVESFYPHRIPQKRTLSPATFFHSMKVIDARLKIAPLWDGDWRPESLLPRATTEIPDAIFTFPSGKEVFIELENSIKGHKRFLRRLESFERPILTLYIATSSEIERTLKRYLVNATRPVGVVLLDQIENMETQVWMPHKIGKPFSKRSF